MTFDEFRRDMMAYRQTAESDAKSFKDATIALEGLRALYAKFDENERRMANRVLGEWALSEDEGVRFDALSLIDDLGIKSAVSALQELANRLVSSAAPSAPYELKKVHRILDSLGK
jgi:hypothetical protein